MNRSITGLTLSRPLFYIVLFTFYLTSSDSVPLMALYALSSALFLTTSAVIADWIPAPPAWKTRALYLEIAASTIVSAVTAVALPGGPMPAIFSPLAITFFFHLERHQLRPAIILTSLLWLLTYLPEAAHHPWPILLLSIGLYGAFYVLSLAMGSLMRELREEKERSEQLLGQVQASRAALAAAHQELQLSAARQQEMAVLKERQRLARDIHDSVAHSLSALIVQTQAARRLLERDPALASKAIAQCEETSRQALMETRQAVRALHPSGLDQQGEAEALRRLGRDYGAATGMAVSLEVDDGALALPPDPHRLEQLYRIFQEALTNAHRHGQARQVTAQLRLEGDLLTLSVQNDGAVPTSLDPGVGLRSMAERAGSLGGRITVEPGEVGLNLRVMIPLNQEVAAG